MLDVRLNSEQRERYVRLRASLKPQLPRGGRVTAAGIGGERHNAQGRYTRLLTSLTPQKPQPRDTANTEDMLGPSGDKLSMADE